MDRTTATDIRRILANNFLNLLTRASHGRIYPHKIAIESLTRSETICITTAHFAFEIGAIEAHEYCDLRKLVLDVVDAVTKLRKVYYAKNYISGKTQAISTAKSDVAIALASLRNCLAVIADITNSVAAA